MRTIIRITKHGGRYLVGPHGEASHRLLFDDGSTMDSFWLAPLDHRNGPLKVGDKVEWNDPIRCSERVGDFVDGMPVPNDIHIQLI